MLSIQELSQMHEEMSAKFTRLSEDLIKELQERDSLIRDQEVRNQFVASLMKVEGKKKAVSQAKAQVAANSSSSSKRLVLKAKSTLKKKGESSNDIISQCKVSHFICLISIYVFNCRNIIENLLAWLKYPFSAGCRHIHCKHLHRVFVEFSDIVVLNNADKLS